MLAASATTLPEGLLWTYEVKWDGYRALAIKQGPRVQILSRNQKDLTRDYPDVVAAIRTLRVADAVLDGEIVAVDNEGRPSFQGLQHRITTGLTIVYYAFDLLRVGRESLLAETLVGAAAAPETGDARFTGAAIRAAARLASPHRAGDSATGSRRRDRETEGLKVSAGPTQRCLGEGQVQSAAGVRDRRL